MAAKNKRQASSGVSTSCRICSYGCLRPRELRWMQLILQAKNIRLQLGRFTNWMCSSFFPLHVTVKIDYCLTWHRLRGFERALKREKKIKINVFRLQWKRFNFRNDVNVREILWRLPFCKSNDCCGRLKQETVNSVTHLYKPLSVQFVVSTKATYNWVKQ